MVMNTREKDEGADVDGEYELNEEYEFQDVVGAVAKSKIVESVETVKDTRDEDEGASKKPYMTIMSGAICGTHN